MKTTLNLISVLILLTGGFAYAQSVPSHSSSGSSSAGPGVDVGDPIIFEGPQGLKCPTLENGSSTTICAGKNTCATTESGVRISISNFGTDGCASVSVGENGEINIVISVTPGSSLMDLTINPATNEIISVTVNGGTPGNLVTILGSGNQITNSTQNASIVVNGDNNTLNSTAGTGPLGGGMVSVTGAGNTVFNLNNGVSGTQYNSFEGLNTYSDGSEGGNLLNGGWYIIP